MQNIAKIYENQSSERFFGTARIVRTDESQGQVIAVPAGLHIKKEITARLAIPLFHKLASGDDVLVAEGNNDNFFVLGVLNKNSENSDPAPKMIVADGTFASINSSENGQKLGVYSNNNELIFEYDPDTKKARIFSDAEDMVFDAPNGNIKFNAAGNIHLKGHQVELSGRSGIGLSVGQVFEKIRSGISLKPGKIDVASQEVKISAQRASLFLDEARNNIKAVVSKIGSAKMIVDKLETTASSIIEKTKNSYRTTENLSQVKAGRMRMLIQKTFHLGSRSSIIKAKEDVKVKGEKIHLG